MKLICVGGVSSGCGKTTVANLLLKAFEGWAAMKVVPSELNAICRHGRDCGFCTPPDGLYAITFETDAAASKDTASFLRAGAVKAALVRAVPKCLPTAIEMALNGMRCVEGVVIESTAAIPYVTGVRIVVMPCNPVEIKDSAQKALSLVDLIVLNQRTNDAGCVFAEAVDKPFQIVNAALPPEDVRNRKFINACRRLLQKTNGCGVVKPG